MNFASYLFISLCSACILSVCANTGSSTEPFYVYLDEAHTETLLPFSGYYIQFHNCHAATYKNHQGTATPIPNYHGAISKPTIGLVELLNNASSLEVTCRNTVNNVPSITTLHLPKVTYPKTSQMCALKLTDCGSPKLSQPKTYCSIGGKKLDYSCAGYNTGQAKASYITTDDKCLGIAYKVGVVPEAKPSINPVRPMDTVHGLVLLELYHGGYGLDIHPSGMTCAYTQGSNDPHPTKPASGPIPRSQTGGMILTEILAVHSLIKVVCKQIDTDENKPIAFPFFVAKSSLDIACSSAQNPQPHCTLPAWFMDANKDVPMSGSNGQLSCSHTFHLCSAHPFKRRKLHRLTSSKFCKGDTRTPEPTSVKLLSTTAAEKSSSITGSEATMTTMTVQKSNQTPNVNTPPTTRYITSTVAASMTSKTTISVTAVDTTGKATSKSSAPAAGQTTPNIEMVIPQRAASQSQNGSVNILAVLLPILAVILIIAVVAGVIIATRMNKKKSDGTDGHEDTAHDPIQEGATGSSAQEGQAAIPATKDADRGVKELSQAQASVSARDADFSEGTIPSLSPRGTD